MSRLENAPSRIEVARMTAALVDLFCRSFPSPPAAITLDIDDTCDAVHGQQQLSLFNAHYDTRCFLPVHVYHVESGKPVAVLLRPGKTPSGARSAPSSSTWCAASAGTGRAPGSPSGETATTAGPRPWRGARRTASTTSSAWRAIPCCTASHTASPTTSRCAAPRPAPKRCGASPPSTTPPVRGTANVARLEASARGFDARYIVTSLGGESL